MELLEVTSNIAKIKYNPAHNHLLPSDFLLIEDKNQKLIAQINNISTTEKEDINTAEIRLILAIDKNDNLSYYNGYIPLKSSSVVYIHPDEIIELIKSSNENIYFGNLSNHNDCFVQVPLSCINDRVYIQSDRNDKIRTLIQNISAELISKQQKVVILDFNGNYNPAGNIPQLKIADSFKLPLNIDAFDNIIEYDTTDCPIEDKAVIQSIVLELREYIKTIENKFLPFTLFKTVIDNEYSSNPISGLMLLRNKLWLYAQEGIFAESKTQFEILNNILTNQNIVIIDASELEDKWYKFTIQTIQNLVKQKCYFVLSLNDINADKKTITGLYGNSNVIPIIYTSYDSKYRQILKSICKNQILFRPSKEVNDEEAYNSFLNRINSGEFILYGESDLYIPLIVELQAFTAKTKENVTENEIKKEVDKIFTGKTPIPAETTPKAAKAANPVQDIIRPMSFTEDEIPYEEPKTDTDFNDDDLDFLDEKDSEKITIEDIKGTKEEPTEEKKYDVFSPYKEEKDIQIELKEDEPEPVKNIEELKDDNISDDLDNEKDLQIIDSNLSEIEEIKDEKDISSSTEITNIDDTYLNDNYPENEAAIQIIDDNAQEVLPQEQKNEIADISDIIDDLEPVEDIQGIEDIDDIASKNIEQTEYDENSNITDITDEVKNIEEPVANKIEEIQPKDNIESEIKPIESEIEDILDDVTENEEEELEEEKERNDITPLDDIISDIEEKAVRKSEKEESIDSILDDLDDKEMPDAPKVNKDIKQEQRKQRKLQEYDAGLEEQQDIVSSCPFKVHDKVFHPKHGYGTVKEVIPFGNKIIFCKIDFDTKGIRLLDPRVSGLEKA